MPVTARSVVLPIIVAAFGMWPLGGCNRTPAPPKVAKVAPAAAKQPPPKVVSPGDDAPGPVEAADSQQVDGDQPPTTDTLPPTTPPPPPTFASERIVIFAPQNPLLVEFRLSIDGKPHVEAMDELVGEVLQLADTDGDGRTMWSELTASPRFKYGQFGNLPIDGDNGPKQIVERYDIDRDGVVDREELPRFLTRNAGGSRPFSIRGTIDDSPSGRRSSPLWQVLDADDDARLSPEEIAAAPQRLRSRDADDDEILVAAELMALSTAMPGQMPTRRRYGREAARLLGPHATWDTVRSDLEEQYALGGALREEHFPLSPGLFTFLDANSDGRVFRKEVERLSEAPPHLIIAVDLRTEQVRPTPPPEQAASEAEDTKENASEAAPAEAIADATKESPAAVQEKPARLRVLEFGEGLAGEKHATQVGDDRLLVRAGGSTLLFYLNDTLASANYEQQAEQGLAMFDGDKNGYLEESEVLPQAQAAVGRFEAVDTDGDGKVYAGEIATYLAQQQRALRSQVHARVEGKPDPLRDVLDRNDDGRIDARETDAASRRLQELDANGDGEIDIDEIPAGLVVGIARGNLENQDALFVMPTTRPIGPAEGAPRWFRQMDANRDGSISPREFLGPVELFDELDADSDGFLTPDEAGSEAKSAAVAG